MAKRLQYCCILSALLFRYANRESEENHTRGQEWKAKANCRQRQAETHALAPLQLCLLPNATVARWRCCLSTNQFTIDFFRFFFFLFVLFIRKTQKVLQLWKTSSDARAALRCRLSLSRCAAAAAATAAAVWHLIMKCDQGAVRARAPLCRRWLHVIAGCSNCGSHLHRRMSERVRQCVSECACIPFLGTLIECVTS